ncbi:FG-GAP repeat domain-containing protein [Fibrivirga algicola]|uniref:VCBS repeat-containing protein n=1 Tax=Fibrivirga algicola TaxID=2950420 RepID=A0ABX0QJF6_9BACT|nr:VCBS repeat-containing protein [Fibrivirga algicola]NID12409.1 VCBS repeat-containing protein [Fibrivirga algicola]
MKQLLALTGLILSGFTLSQSANPPRFVKYFVAAESYESAGVVDVDGNGTLDIVSGDFWYENEGGNARPTFRKRHLIGHQKREDQYYDDFSTIPFDVNGDGRPDIVTGGWWSGKLRWLENVPKGDWPIHEIATVGNVETTRAWDIDGDGKPEICPNNPSKPLVYLTYQSDRSFKPVQVHQTQGHGLGFGDLNGDGRGDFIVSDGWLQQGGDKRNPTWTHYPEFSLGTASVPILIADVNGDKLNDLIVGQGHGYGLHWYSQGVSGGKRTWTKHTIDEKNSQYHVMEWVDITGDGKPELVTGKRFRAHNDSDPGSDDPVGLYYFTVEHGAFKKNVISYGPAGEGKGTGIQFATADLRRNGRTDLVVAGKDGLYVFFNEK